MKTTASPFFLYSLLRVMLGVGLMNDAYYAGSVFQVQRSVYHMVASSSLYCTDGTLPTMKLTNVNPSVMTGSLEFQPPTIPVFPTLPDMPPIDLPNGTYEWIAVQLRWICATLVYFVVITSIVMKRLSTVLNETQDANVAEQFERSLWYAQCVESCVVYLSFMVYIVEKAYEMQMQYSLSGWFGNTGNHLNQNDAFVAEMFIVILVGIVGLLGMLLQYNRFRTNGANRDTNESFDTTSML